MEKNILKKKGTHDQNRAKVCLLCLKKESRCSKTKFVKIFSKGKVEVMIKTLFEYSVSDERLPNPICSGCLRKLYRIKDGSQETIDLSNLSQFYAKTTRSTSLLPCMCKICYIARDPLFKNDTKANILKPIRGNNRVANRRCKGSFKKSKNQKLCKTCFTLIAKGQSHKCNSSRQFVNLQTIPKSRDQIIATVLKEKIKEIKKPEQKYTVALSQYAGKPLRISVNPPNKENCIKTPKIFVIDIQKIQTSFNLTQNTTLGIASMIRVASCNRKVIEPNLKKALSSAIHSLDEFFEVKSFDFINMKANNASNVKQYVVYCKNLDGLIESNIKTIEIDEKIMKPSEEDINELRSQQSDIQETIEDFQWKKVVHHSIHHSILISTTTCWLRINNLLLHLEVQTTQ
ncbi:unnamed protein product [Brassicogethes aeneus]|uniref:ZAD domain-containing protein n=1 Tax=Brassicogethes aeneus TaxID=1431903 RepID=A0A9P0AZ76_BRAAE|nr:unnamed protein product [Brassicogethes aeneus]